MRTVPTLRSAALALALATSGAGHGASAQQYTTLAYGGIKCADWTSVRSSKPAEAAVYEAWILGFISAYKAFIYKGPNVAAGTDFDSCATWSTTTARPIRRTISIHPRRR